jgi:hypothetical protein
VDVFAAESRQSHARSEGARFLSPFARRVMKLLKPPCLRFSSTEYGQTVEPTHRS